MAYTISLEAKLAVKTGSIIGSPSTDNNFTIDSFRGILSRLLTESNRFSFLFFKIPGN